MGEVIYNLSGRLKNLKENYLKSTPSISVSRALAVTEVFKEFPDLPTNILRAKAFRRSCETAPMFIQENELIVGHPCGKARAGAFSPDTAWVWLRDELDTISTRAQDPYYISDENKKILQNEIFPFWEGKSLAESCEKQLRKEGLWVFGAEACVSDLTYHVTSGGGDTSPGYDIILFKKGIFGIKAEAESHLTTLSMDRIEDRDKIGFYMSAIETCEGIITYAARLSAYALKMAQEEQNPKRKKELEKISEINTRVPANPPKTFQEALQAVWTIQSLFLMEENQCSTSLGRVDQYMFPYYKSDIDAGVLTEHGAFELMGCFIIKCSEMIWYTPKATAKYFAGYMPFINMCWWAKA